MRLKFVALALLPIVGLAGAAPLVLPAEAENVVEGHVVFTTLHNPHTQDVKGEMAAATAILVRERQYFASQIRFPGVLWFNDQYLVNPMAHEVDFRDRWPCTGAVLAVNSGDPDPRLLVDAGLLDGSTYNESYLVRDPNNRDWQVHKWNVSRGAADAAAGTTSPPTAPANVTVWTVALFGALPHQTMTPDNGQCSRTPVKDSVSKASNPARYGYPCGGNGGPTCQNSVWYNALLFFYLEDLTIPQSPKNHSDGSTDRARDVTGCHGSGSPRFREQWPCPGGDDDREGNSHNYNPRPVHIANAERSTHGFSDDCTGDGIADRDCHATRSIDVYYGVAPTPALVRWRFIDVEGSTAPYHCHQDPSVDICGA